MISSDGPKVAIGDVNQDGKSDVYVCGASGQPGHLFVQDDQGSFYSTNASVFQLDKISEDTDAAFFDSDQDGDLDLYVASGGNEFKRHNKYLADRLYLNDGSGLFVRASQIFDTLLYESSSCVRPSDYDGDGDIDLFVGTRLITGVYGIPASSFLWENNGKGKFTDKTASVAPALREIGLVTDANWLDYDNDRDQDLLVVGEWMPITLLKNERGIFSAVPQKSGLNKSNGLWTCIESGDLDGDGFDDLIIGNHGLNTRFKASTDRPLQMFVNDFDGNRTAEQIICKYENDIPFPFILRHDLVMQIPSLKKKYLLFNDFKQQRMEDIFSEKAIRTAARSEVYQTATCVAWNNGGGGFELSPLPLESQFAPAFAILIKDLDRDGLKDILLGGNFHRAKPEVGKYDASYGLVLQQLQNRQFTSVLPMQSGLQLDGEIRDFKSLEVGDKSMILVARNNDSLLFFYTINE